MRMRQQIKSDTLPVPKPYSITSVSNVIAVIDSGYTKHTNVFRLATSDGRQYLFRAESKQDMEEWITKINFTAAFKSSDVLPRGVCPQVFTNWCNGLPQIKHFDFEKDDQVELRTRIIKSRIAHFDKLIQTVQKKLNADRKLLEQLGMMVVLTRTARDHALASIEKIQARIRRFDLDFQRYRCYREILMHDFTLAALSSKTPSSHETTGSLPIDI